MAFPQGTLRGPLARLLSAPMRPGRIVWIGRRPARRAPLEPLEQVLLDPVTGLEGDHYSNGGTRSRQVTLIGQESLAAIAAYVGRPAIPPGMLRRNIVIGGINPHALKGQTIRLGSAVLAITGECHPCSRMEEILGPGGYNAVRGHGGVTARIVTGGVARLGDLVERGDAPG